MFFWAASFENRACWNTSLSGYDRVERWTVTPDGLRRAISSSAAVGAPSDRLQPCLLLTSAPCKAVGGNVRYVYGVIEPHGVRYKQSQASHARRGAAG